MQTKSITRKLTMTIVMISAFFVAEIAVLFLTSSDFLADIDQLRTYSWANESVRKTKQLISTMRRSLQDLQQNSNDTNASQIFAAAEKEALVQLNVCEELFFADPEIHETIFEAKQNLQQLREKVLSVHQNDTRAKNLVVEQFILEWNENLNKILIYSVEKSNLIFEHLYAIRLRPILSSAILAMLFLLLALTTGLQISKRLKKSTRNLIDSIGIIAEGNLNHRAQILEKDEIGLLTHAVNLMVNKLQDSTVSKHHVENIINSMLDALLVIKPDGSILRANPATEKVFGYSESEMLNKSINSFMLENVRELSELKNTEITCIKKDGKKIPAIISISTLTGGFQSDNEVCIIKDVSEIRSTQEDLRDKNLQLANANKELEAFSYSVSHDLRAPLRAVDGFSQALLEDYGESLDDEGRRYLNRIRTAIQRMGSLIDDILKLSRINRSEMTLEQVDLSVMATDIARDLKEYAAKDRSIEFVIPSGLFCIADRAFAQIVLENLLNNSVKYTSRHPTARIEIGETIHNGMKMFFVKDDGAGFDMAYSQKLFGAFQRLHRDSEFPGNGVGLATVQRIINRHNGQISVDATVEKGATFYFSFGTAPTT